jgi:hypothetical protein
MAGTAVLAGTGVNAVEMTDATQVVVPPRRSETVTSPSGPETLPDVFDVPSDPSDTLPVGALIVSAPPVTVKVAGVAAPAGGAVAPTRAAVRAAKVVARRQSFRVLRGSSGVVTGFMAGLLCEDRDHRANLPPVRIIVATLIIGDFIVLYIMSR